MLPEARLGFNSRWRVEVGFVSFPELRSWSSILMGLLVPKVNEISLRCSGALLRQIRLPPSECQSLARLVHIPRFDLRTNSA